MRSFCAHRHPSPIPAVGPSPICTHLLKYLRVPLLSYLVASGQHERVPELHCSSTKLLTIYFGNLLIFSVFNNHLFRNQENRWSVIACFSFENRIAIEWSLLTNFHYEQHDNGHIGRRINAGHMEVSSINFHRSFFLSSWKNKSPELQGSPTHGDRVYALLRSGVLPGPYWQLFCGCGSNHEQQSAVRHRLHDRFVGYGRPACGDLLLAHNTTEQLADWFVWSISK